MDRSCTHPRKVLAFVLLMACFARADADDVKAVLRDSYFNKVSAGVQIVKLGDSLEADQIVVDSAAATPFAPASNLKLLTTAAAIDQLGADFRFRTVVARKGDTLALVGDGDPTLGDSKLMQELGLSTNTVAEHWAAALLQRGIKSADKLLYDDSIFDEHHVHEGWPDNQLHKWYCAGVAGLNYNVNCLDFYLKPAGRGEVVGVATDPPTQYAPIENTCVYGSRNAVWLSRHMGQRAIILGGQTDGANSEPLSVTVHEPAAFAATVTREVFAKAGVAIESIEHDRTVRDNIKDWELLIVHETPLPPVLLRANRDSINVYADALCKRLGAKLTEQPGSWESGTAAMGKYLKSIDVPEAQYKLVDGSGLSRENRISAAALTTILRRQYHSDHRDLFVNSLAVSGGKLGTLKRRFDDTPQRGRVLAKSGSIDGVSSLSGYLKREDGTWYAFSIIMNDVTPGTGWLAHQMQERLVGALDR